MTQRPTQGLSPEHAEWLEEKRGLSAELCARFGLVSRGDQLGFPYRLNDAVRFAKWRHLDKSGMRISPPGVPLSLYNLDALSEVQGLGNTLVITEGELDCIAVAHTGNYAVSVPHGAPAKVGEGDIVPTEDSGFKYLWLDGKLHPSIDKFQRIVLFGDNDGPGRNLNAELAIRLGRARCWVPDFPEGCKDANDILLHHGVEGLSTAIQRAKPIVPSKFVPYSEIPFSEPKKGLESGWSGLDQHLRLTFPELVTITGTPGAGKSQWTLAWLCNLARLHNVKSAIIQLEDDPSRNRHDLMQYAATWQREHGEQPEDWVDQRFVTKVPPEPHSDEEVVTLDWLREAVEDAALRHDCKVVLIDPWNEIEHAFERGFSETQYTNDALRKIKSLARKYQIAIVIVTHPSKGIVGKGIEDITLYDVSGSQAWNNKSDHGIIVHRDEGDTESKIKVAKCKSYKTMGYPGIVTMQFHPPTASFKFVRSGV